MSSQLSIHCLAATVSALALAGLQGCASPQSAGGGDATVWCPTSQLRDRGSDWECNSGFVSSGWQAACDGGKLEGVKQSLYASGATVGTCPAGTAFGGDSVIQFSRK